MWSTLLLCKKSLTFSSESTITDGKGEGWLTCGVGQVILAWEQGVSQVVVRSHDALGGWGSWSVHVSFSFPLTLPFPLSVSTSVLLPLPVMRWLVTYCGGFALILAGVLMQDIQGFGVRCCFDDSRASARFVAAFFTTSYFTAIWRKRIASG